MPQGGARARSGPAPDPNALRRDRDQKDWVHLPAAGRTAPPPAWPLTRATKRELDLWAGEWRRPQALMWELNGQANEVALYVRSLVEAEARGATTNARTLVRQQQEALGLSLPGLARNHWVIDAGSVAKEMRPTGTEAPSARERFTVVDGGG